MVPVPLTVMAVLVKPVRAPPKVKTLPVPLVAVSVPLALTVRLPFRLTLLLFPFWLFRKLNTALLANVALPITMLPRTASTVPLLLALPSTKCPVPVWLRVKSPVIVTVTLFAKAVAEVAWLGQSQTKFPKVEATVIVAGAFCFTPIIRVVLAALNTKLVPLGVGKVPPSRDHSNVEVASNVNVPSVGVVKIPLPV